MRPFRLAWYTAVHLTYRTGLRGYCAQHDVLRWRWTHRDCCARQREVLGRILAALPPAALDEDEGP